MSEASKNTTTMDVHLLYRRAQKFLALPLDEGIEPDDYGDGEASEAERLVADLAVALAEALPEPDVDGAVPLPVNLRTPLIDHIVLTICEFDDRTSPEDQPEMLLVTADELRGVISRAFELADEGCIFPTPGGP